MKATTVAVKRQRNQNTDAPAFPCTWLMAHTGGRGKHRNIKHCPQSLCSFFTLFISASSLVNHSVTSKMPISSRKAPPRENLGSYRPLPAPRPLQQSTYGREDRTAPPYERYASPIASQPLPATSFAHDHAIEHQVLSSPRSEDRLVAPRLPFFEAALAQSREVGTQRAPEALVLPQPLPSYFAPPDPNHPDLSVGLMQSNTIRLALGQGAAPYRSMSRSPSPPPADATAMASADQSNEDGPLLLDGDYLRDDAPSRLSGPPRIWDEKLSSLGLQGVNDHDLSRDLRGGAISQFHFQDDEKYPAEDLLADTGDLAASTTQHFGPAPTGRVGRRTHNAAGGRRIRHTATLDENGFFAVDMPIPTRLAQFLPFKGVEEQKCTRSAPISIQLNPV